MALCSTLAGLSMLKHLATDIKSAAFGAMREELQISAGAVSASLSIFLCRLRLRAAVLGPLSDRALAANRSY